MKEDDCGSFSLEGRNQLTWENDKGKSNQKVGLKRWNLEALEKEKPKVNLLRSARMGKLAGVRNGNKLGSSRVFLFAPKPAFGSRGPRPIMLSPESQFTTTQNHKHSLITIHKPKLTNTKIPKSQTQIIEIIEYTYNEPKN